MTDPAEFRLVHRLPPVSATAYWLTHAGGGTAALVHRMGAIGGDCHVEVRSPWLPAREQRRDVTFHGDLDELARRLADAIIREREQQASALPFALIGHSFGGALAYRVACELVARHVVPGRLVVLAFPAPDRPSHEPALHRLGDAELVQQADAIFGGFPPQLRDDVETLRHFLPALRMDLGLIERYRHDPQAPRLPIPITAIAGTEDRAVGLPQMQRWQQFTSSAFRLQAMPGDHFFPLARMREILRIAAS